MNTITKSASTNVIVAVDLGKYKSVACVHDPATGRTGPVYSLGSSIHELLSWQRQSSPAPAAGENAEKP
jgi:hypothetical protein